MTGQNNGSAVTSTATSTEVTTRTPDESSLEMASRLYNPDGTAVKVTIQSKSPHIAPSNIQATIKPNSSQTVLGERLEMPTPFPEDGKAPASSQEGDKAHRVGGAQGSHAFRAVAPSETEALVTPEFPHLAQIPPFTLDERWQLGDVQVIGTPPKTLAQQEIIPTGPVYLFHVIVALEWRPSYQTLDTLMRAFRSASDTLYDATNGGAAFGQVVFAGPEHLSKADIQILASNRFHPRSMVGGLTDPAKFSPIRLGRGIWRKDSRILIPWNETTGYRAIAHEWAHYALGLHDEYIDAPIEVYKSSDGLRLHKQTNGAKAEALEIVVPRIMVALQTIMETLDSDELVPHLGQFQRAEQTQRANKLLERILNEVEKKFPSIRDRLTNYNPGPHSFPLPLPRFFCMPDGSLQPPDQEQSTHRGEESWCNVDTLELDHSWLYSYRWNEQQLQIIAQGSIDDQARVATLIGGEQGAGFQLLGAQAGDQLLAIGIEPGDSGATRPHGLRSNRVTTIEGQQAKLKDPDWSDSSSIDPPVVAVIPSAITPEEDKRATVSGELPQIKVRVRIIDDTRDQIWLATPGEDAQPLVVAPNGKDIRTSGSYPIRHMDGLVAFERGSRIGWVAEFSYGGNGPTTVRGSGAPINAGSSDGNLMIFSALDEELANQGPEARKQYYNKPIVTTRNYAGFEEEGKKVGRPASYLFSVAAAERVALEQRPTIVMYFDAGALEEDNLLVIHRFNFDDRQWEQLPTYVPPGAFYAATPLNGETAPKLTCEEEPESGRVEYYRLFSIAAGSPTTSA